MLSINFTRFKIFDILKYVQKTTLTLWMLELMESKIESNTSAPIAFRLLAPI